MSVSSEEFTRVGGLLNVKAMFPGESPQTVTAKLTQWISDAGDDDTVSGLSSTAQQDRGTRSFVKARAWDEVYQRLVALPTSVEAAGEGAASYLVTQIELARDERDAAEAALASLAALDEDSEAETFQVLKSFRD